jgi:hypothetical protein
MFICPEKHFCLQNKLQRRKWHKEFQTSRWGCRDAELALARCALDTCRFQRQSTLRCICYLVTKWFGTPICSIYISLSTKKRSSNKSAYIKLLQITRRIKCRNYILNFIFNKTTEINVHTRLSRHKLFSLKHGQQYKERTAIFLFNEENSIREKISP